LNVFSPIRGVMQRAYPTPFVVRWLESVYNLFSLSLALSLALALSPGSPFLERYIISSLSLSRSLSRSLCISVSLSLSL